MKLYGKIKRNWNIIRHAGSNHTCSVCGYNGKQFLSAGLTLKRKNAKCPSCGSLERHRQMVLIFKSLNLFSTSASLLHFAPEPCLSAYLKKQLGDRYKTTHYNEKSKSDYSFDIRNIDCADHLFKYIICSHVLEHIDQDTKAMKELYRVLKPGGIAFIQVPLWPSESHPTYENSKITDARDRAIHFGQFDHVRIYGLDVIERLKLAGFDVEVIDLCQTLNAETIYKYALKNNSQVRDLTFVCRKK